MPISVVSGHFSQVLDDGVEIPLRNIPLPPDNRAPEIDFMEAVDGHLDVLRGAFHESRIRAEKVSESNLNCILQTGARQPFHFAPWPRLPEQRRVQALQFLFKLRPSENDGDMARRRIDVIRRLVEVDVVIGMHERIYATTAAKNLFR